MSAVNGCKCAEGVLNVSGGAGGQSMLSRAAVVVGF